MLLSSAEQTARKTSLEQRARMRFLWRAARRRMAAASGLRSPDEIGPAFRLMSEAFVLLATAHAVAGGEFDGESSLGAEAAFELVRARLPDAPLAGLETTLTDADPLAPDRLEVARALELRPALERLLTWLERRLELRTVRRIRVARVLRFAAALAVLLLLSIAGVAVALSPSNLARGKPVRTSSVFPNTPDPSGATDGTRGRGFGVHTAIEANPWVEVDLGSVQTLTEVVIYHRSDSFQMESLPLVLQLSEDGAAYVNVTTRSELFTADKPWHARVAGKRARYVRLAMTKSKGYIALSEIEVY